MAIPPEPIDEVLPQASAAVLAEVTRILVQDPQPELPDSELGAADVPGDAARQVVELGVREVLFGAQVFAGTKLEVVKPAGDYALRVGNQGPFLLRAAGPGEATVEILGRYGPDTYPLELIKRAMQRHGKA